jgi:Cu2+-exporting ATPase
MEHSNHSEHRQDGMGHDMHKGHRETGSKDDDHTGHHAHMAADFRKRFWISLVLTLPILALSPLLQKLVGLRDAIRFAGDIYVLFGFASAVFWYGGWPFLKGLFKELKSRSPSRPPIFTAALSCSA